MQVAIGRLGTASGVCARPHAHALCTRQVHTHETEAPLRADWYCAAEGLEPRYGTFVLQPLRAKLTYPVQRTP